jgi:non-specific serine/threonine protein kinase
VGDYTRARELAEERIALHRQSGSRLDLLNMLLHRGEVALDEDDAAAAGSAFREALTLARQAGSEGHASAALEALGTVAVLRGQAERAARLFGAMAALGGSIGNWPLNPERQERSLEAARAALGVEAFEAAWAAGRAMALANAIAYALET